MGDWLEEEVLWNGHTEDRKACCGERKYLANDRLDTSGHRRTIGEDRMGSGKTSWSSHLEPGTVLGNQDA